MCFFSWETVAKIYSIILGCFLLLSSKLLAFYFTLVAFFNVHAKENSMKFNSQSQSWIFKLLVNFISTLNCFEIPKFMQSTSIKIPSCFSARVFIFFQFKTVWNSFENSFQSQENRRKTHKRWIYCLDENVRLIAVFWDVLVVLNVQ